MRLLQCYWKYCWKLNLDTGGSKYRENRSGTVHGILLEGAGYRKNAEKKAYLAPVGLSIIDFSSGVRRGQNNPFTDHHLLQYFASRKTSVSRQLLVPNAAVSRNGSAVGHVGSLSSPHAPLDTACPEDRRNSSILGER